MKDDFLVINKAAISENLVMDTIDDDFFLFDNISSTPMLYSPTRMDTTISAICLNGSMEISIDLKRYVLEAPNFVVVHPDQILQTHSRSSNFSGLFVVMSKKFISSIQLNIQDTIPIFFYLKENPSTVLTQSELDLLLSYFSLLKQTMKMENNVFRKEIIQHLAHAFFYGVATIFQNHQPPENEKKSRKEMLFDNFLKMLAAHHKQCRNVSFYADKLCLTPKHLSSAIKEISGSTAGKWIDDYVMLEAKALLKSTDMTIQQISDELNFANQSFFGKYFKHFSGMSPKMYREN
ncbi:MAG: helix-turn-helix domain-containing protein [Prevotellaceae bacterium]|jgi:AraC-like DNA-binding protein|nr:helix-turn-helix domain-containing protein [Prevotellaceae bacterium]